MSRIERKPLAYDLCCGDGGATDGLLAAGYRVIGFDITHFSGYRGELVLQDVRTIDGYRLAGADVIWASPPCNEFSQHRMPWTRRRAVEPDMSIVNACLRIQKEARPRVFVLENVMSAQRWLGQAILHRGPFYFWGDVALLPDYLGRKKESYGSNQAHLRAKVPFEIAKTVGMMASASRQAP